MKYFLQGERFLAILLNSYNEDMTVNKHVLHNATMVLLAVLVVTAGFALVATATDDDDVYEWDVDAEDDPDVPFGSVVEATGDGIEADQTYNVEVWNTDSEEYESTWVTSSTDDAVLDFDTETVDGDVEDPRGEYRFSEQKDGDVEMNTDEVHDGEATEVFMASANVDYEVTLYEVDEDGDRVNTLGTSDVIDAEDEARSLHVSFDEESGGYTESPDVHAVVYSADEGEELAADDGSIVYDDGADVTDETNFEDSDEQFMAEWSITANDYEDTDDRVEIDAKDEVYIDVYVGQQLIIADNDFEEGATYQINHVDGDDSSTVTEVAVQDSDTVNDAEVVIDTTYESHQGFDDLEGDFELVNDNGETVTEWEVEYQHFDVDAEPNFINLNTQETEVDVNVSTNRLDFDVLIESEELDADEIGDLIVDEELGDEQDVEVHSDDDTDHVRVTGVAQSDSLDTIVMDFDGVSSNDYDFEFSVADALGTEEFEVTAEFGTQGNADFNLGTYEQEQGDVAQFDIDLDATDTATFRIAEDDYDLEFEVYDGAGNGEVTLYFDTYHAGEGGTVEEVFWTEEEEDEVENVALPEVSNDIFGTGLYTMELEVDDDESDLATLQVVDRESHGIHTHVMPKDHQDSTDELYDYGTEQDSIAYEDWLVVEVHASGFYSLIDDDTHPAALVDFSEREGISDMDELDSYSDVDLSDVEEVPELSVSVTEINEDRHAEPKRLELENARNLEVDADENRFFLFFQTGDDNVDAEPRNEFESSLNVTDNYHYEDENENDADLDHTFEVVDRDVELQLPAVTVDEIDLDTRFALPQENNVTVWGETEIAPGTDVSLRVRSEGVDPILMRQDVNVEDDGTVEGEYDLSNLEVDRNMTVQFFPMTERKPAIITEPESPPEIVDVNATTPVAEGDEVEFSIDVEDENADAVTYDWDFDDGGSSGASEPVHVYDEPGTYEVSVTATDPAGQTDTATVEVVVEEIPNEPPVIEEVIGPDDVSVDNTANFGVIASDDTDTDELTYEWDMGDGSTDAGVSVQHAFSAEGVYDVEVTVTDNEGESVSQTKTVSVTDDGESSDPNGEPSGDEHVLDISVVDAETDDPIDGATVSIQEGDDTIDGGESDESGAITFNVEDGNYNIQVIADGYEDGGAAIPIDGEDESITLNMEEEEEEDPEQPGFGLVMATLALISIGGFVYYRRKVQA